MSRVEQNLKIIELVLQECPDMSLNRLLIMANVYDDTSVNKLLKLAESLSPRFVFTGKHLGDPCIYCGCPHDEVEIGLCPGNSVTSSNTV